MSKNTQKKAENKALVAKLQEASKTATKSEVAQSVATAQAVKVRDVKDFVVRKANTELDADKRKVIQERRSYMLSALDTDNSEVYNATMYRDENNQLVLFSQAIANKAVADYVSKLASMQKFNAQNIMSLLKTCGGAYGDKVRNALYSISLQTTASELEADVNAVIAKAKEKQKLCIYYNVLEDSRRAKYDFIKF
ncbi:MAG: hypothetical protein PHV42_04545 [Candidatus Pacebacteria bacterium]|nr:hypothetical protein [Candidatus Paceibacterota bacterium]